METSKGDVANRGLQKETCNLGAFPVKPITRQTGSSDAACYSIVVKWRIAFYEVDPLVVWKIRRPKLLAAVANAGYLVNYSPSAGEGCCVALVLAEDTYLDTNRGAKRV